MSILPGVWHCPSCGFILHKMLLRAHDMAVGINLEHAREVCPNDGITLVAMEDPDDSAE